MRLSPHEVDKFSLQIVCGLAQKRLSRGIRLNCPEAIALLVCQVIEFAREGRYSVSELMSIGRTILGKCQVIPGVSNLLSQFQIETVFPDGTKLVTLHNPVCLEHGSLSLALQGTSLPVPDLALFVPHPEEGLVPGHIHCMDGFIALNSSQRHVNDGREKRADEVVRGRVVNRFVRLTVVNCADRPIQVGSHYHFIETNPYLCFDRERAYGKRLNIAAGTSVRFEPGETKTVSLVDIGDLNVGDCGVRKAARGGNGLSGGALATEIEREGESEAARAQRRQERAQVLARVMQRVREGGFLDSRQILADGARDVQGAHDEAQEEARAGAGTSKRRKVDSRQLLDLCREIHSHDSPPADSSLNSSSIASSSFSELVAAEEARALVRVSREEYCRMHGPTVGDIIRLADTELYVRVERDLCCRCNCDLENEEGKEVRECECGWYGDECVFGGGKVLREGMGQATSASYFAESKSSSSSPSDSSDSSDFWDSDELPLDTVITGAVVIDHSGIFRADVGIRGGFIAGLGKAGNRETMRGVSRALTVGANTEVIAGEGMILTAGGADSHIHFICPQIAETALASGITTLIGGGTGPASGSCATTCTPSARHLRHMLQATDGLPLNILLTGKGNCSDARALTDIVRAGAGGLKLHEDWGSTPSAIDTCLSVADEEDIQVTIHTDTLNESCCLEGSLAAIGTRTIHTYHSEGAGGGHAPDIIRVCSLAHVIPSSTNPTRPLTANTAAEHLDMLLVCHHLDASQPEDLAFAESRIRTETIAAEDLLQDSGAIAIISSDSQAMGRAGEVVARTWQTADKMKKQFGQLAEDAAADEAHFRATGRRNPPPLQSCDPRLREQPIKTDNFRVRRYVAKYTANPCLAHGVGDLLGQVRRGFWADLALWRPASFAVRPELVLKGGEIAWAAMGEANASIPCVEPVLMRPMFGASARVAADCSFAFVSARCVREGVADSYKLQKRVRAVRGCRSVGKKDMKMNCAMPEIAVDPETYRVTADGIHLTCEPAKTVPLSQRYFLS